jgi:hypothetical protein
MKITVTYTAEGAEDRVDVMEMPDQPNLQDTLEHVAARVLGTFASTPRGWTGFTLTAKKDA